MEMTARQGDKTKGATHTERQRREEELGECVLKGGRRQEKVYVKYFSASNSFFPNLTKNHRER